MFRRPVRSLKASQLSAFFRSPVFSTPTPIYTPSFSRNFASSIPTLTESKKMIGERDEFIVPTTNLNSGYKELHSRFRELIKHAKIAACVSPALSGIWMLATQQMLFDSPVAVAMLAMGAITVTERMLQIKRINHYAKLSTITAINGLSTFEADNQRAREIITGDGPKVKFHSEGIKVSGTIGDVKHPSQVIQKTLSHIQAMRRVVVPECALNGKGDKLVSLTYDRWLARLVLPISILNMVSFMDKKREDRTIDDYIVFASSGYNVYDYLSGPSVADARQKLTNALSRCSTVEQVLKVLVDARMIEQGAMSFLKEWTKNEKSIGVRVSRTGDVIFYNSRSMSFGGPYPIQLFPLPKAKTTVDEVECNKAMSHSLK